MIFNFSKFCALFAAVAAIDTDSMLMLMMSQQSMYQGNNNQMNQMNMLMPMVLLNKHDSKESDNSDILMLMMLQNPSAARGDLNMLLPLMLIQKDEGAKSDKNALFLMMAMMNRDQSCTGLGNERMGEQIMAHMLLENQAGKDDLIMTMLLMQSMSQSNQNSAFSANSLIPHLIVDQMMESDSSDSSLLAMVMMNSLTGGGRDPQKFDQDFNLLLPLALQECGDDKKCEEKKRDMMIVLMAMQAGNPNSPMTSETILPILLMKDESNNQNLLMFMMMGLGSPCQAPINPPATYYVEPEPVYTAPQPVYVAPKPVYVAPKPVYVAPKPVYHQNTKDNVIRTYEIIDGKRHLVSTEIDGKITHEPETHHDEPKPLPILPKPVYISPNPVSNQPTENSDNDIITYKVDENGQKTIIN